MDSRPQSQRGMLYIISRASRAAQHVPELVATAQRGGGVTCVIATPQAIKFLDRSLLERLTGHPVRSEYKHPDEPDALPRADAMIVFPATFNTINTWALGISDTLALGLLCEYTGLHLPIVVVPCVRTNSELDTHPAFSHSLERLQSYGVEVLYEPDTYPSKNEVPPPVILQRLEQVLAASRVPSLTDSSNDPANGTQ